MNNQYEQNGDYYIIVIIRQQIGIQN